LRIYLAVIDFRATHESLYESVTVVIVIQPGNLGRPAESQRGRNGQGSQSMCSRIVELVALGPELRKLAEHRGKGVNEALFLVHEVLAEAFMQPDRLPTDGLREHLSSQMERRLDNRPSQTARKARVAWPRAMWQRTSAAQSETTARAD
jgi:hypothetical protein